MSKHSVEEVRAVADAIEFRGGAFSPVAVAMLRAYAERIEADEMAADYPECSGDPASCPENEGFGCCKAHAEAITLHPPAQAVPVATLHADGFWTWKGTPPHESNHAGWRMDVFARPPAQADEGAVPIRQYRNVCKCPPDDPFCLCNTRWQDVSEGYFSLYSTTDESREWRTLFARPPAQVAQGEDWRIGMFDRWRAAAQEKGYAGIAEAITAAPSPSPGESE